MQQQQQQYERNHTWSFIRQRVAQSHKSVNCGPQRNDAATWLAGRANWIISPSSCGTVPTESRWARWDTLVQSCLSTGGLQARPNLLVGIDFLTLARFYRFDATDSLSLTRCLWIDSTDSMTLTHYHWFGAESLSLVIFTPRGNGGAWVIH